MIQAAIRGHCGGYIFKDNKLFILIEGPGESIEVIRREDIKRFWMCLDSSPEEDGDEWHELVLEMRERNFKILEGFASNDAQRLCDHMKAFILGMEHDSKR